MIISNFFLFLFKRKQIWERENSKLFIQLKSVIKIRIFKF